MSNKNRNIIFKRALATILLGLFFVLPATSQDKKKIVIRQADKQEYQKQGSNDVFWLVGNVVYEHEGALMKCDSSIYYRSQNKFEAFGNVRINQGDTLRMTGDQMEYDGTTRLLHIIGNVSLTDGKMNLVSDEITYDRSLDLAYYNSGGRLTQEDNILSSRIRNVFHFQSNFGSRMYTAVIHGE